jgi:hypothetical protein
VENNSLLSQKPKIASSLRIFSFDDISIHLQFKLTIFCSVLDYFRWVFNQIPYPRFANISCNQEEEICIINMVEYFFLSC